MPETNGSGRLDRIEALFERMVERHDAQFSRQDAQFDRMVEDREREFKQVMTWQVLTQDRVDRLEIKFEALTDRMDKLVIAIGELVQRLPARTAQ